MPGPSAVPKVSVECTQPSSPAWLADTAEAVAAQQAKVGLVAGMEGTVDDIKLLLTGQLDEIHGVAGNPDGQLRI